ncbi:MAG: SagB/ThcOx family dehydrogenase [bacterium]
MIRIAAVIGLLGILVGGIWVVKTGGDKVLWKKEEASSSRIGHYSERDKIVLPPPKTSGLVSVEAAIAKRRSERDFSTQAVEVEKLSQLLWAAQGITDEVGGFKRAAPSAGALYPLELFIIIGQVSALEPGLYHYLPFLHKLELIESGDLRGRLARAALSQQFIAAAPLSIVITAEYERVTGKYGQRGVTYTHIEVGHVGENLFLQAEALGLATVPVGAFYDEPVSQLLKLSSDLTPLYIMPFGYPRR